MQICMTAERCRTKQSAPRVAMAATRPGTLRQPTLAEEIDIAEKEARVTKALQAVEAHGIKHGMKNPNGCKPQMDKHEGVSHTPTKVSIKSTTPSPAKIDKDGEAWTIEPDGTEVQEEQEENESEEERTRGEVNPRARAGSAAITGPGGKSSAKKSMDVVVKDWLNPDEEKEDTESVH